MKISKWLSVGMLMVGLTLAGCAKKQTTNPEDGMGLGTGSEGSVSESGLRDSDSGNAMGLETIRFPYDSSEIVGENKNILKKNVGILKENPSVQIQIEGHCDERGGIQYNLALGEKRANSVRQQVVAAGIAPSRITTISMGKERPVATGSGEEAWAQNRRANFTITSN